MKEKINVFDYAELITKQLQKGVLLNTNGEKFNSMSISWGHIGILWGKPTFNVYVRQGRYSKAQLDATGEFTISIPLNQFDKKIDRVCGSLSGRDVDKVKEAGLELVEAEVINTPGIRQYPLTIECKIFYTQDFDFNKLPQDIRESMYPQDVPGTYPMENRDHHTMFVGEIVDAYIIV